MFYFRYGGFSFGLPLPTDLKLDIKEVPKNRTLSKVNLSPASFLFSPDSFEIIILLIENSNLNHDLNLSGLS